MIGLDTNVLVRYFIRDDAAQSKKASSLIDSLTADHPGYVSQIALAEFVWVLSRGYKIKRNSIVDAIKILLLSEGLVVEDAKTVWKSLRAYDTSRAEFSDCLIGQTGQLAGCEYTATFDVTASKLSNMQLLK